MRAYFTEGEAIADPGDAGAARGRGRAWIPTRRATALRADRFAEDVREDEELAAQLGIQGVPFFVIDRRYGVSGAQPPEVLLQALERAWGEAVSLRA